VVGREQLADAREDVRFVDGPALPCGVRSRVFDLAAY
jgi:hypothetical protein